MGAPMPVLRNRREYFRIRFLSSNYALYADMSARVMALLGEQVPRLEVYSIDEAFFQNPFPLDSIILEGSRLAEKNYRFTGIPGTIGFGPTWTLAKIAVRMAKRSGKKTLDDRGAGFRRRLAHPGFNFKLPVAGGGKLDRLLHGNGQ